MIYILAIAIVCLQELARPNGTSFNLQLPPGSSLHVSDLSATHLNGSYIGTQERILMYPIQAHINNRWEHKYTSDLDRSIFRSPSSHMALDLGGTQKARISCVVGENGVEYLFSSSNLSSILLYGNLIPASASMCMSESRILLPHIGIRSNSENKCLVVDVDDHGSPVRILEKSLSPEPVFGSVRLFRDCVLFLSRNEGDELPRQILFVSPLNSSESFSTDTAATQVVLCSCGVWLRHNNGDATLHKGFSDKIKPELAMHAEKIRDIEGIYVNPESPDVVILSSGDGGYHLHRCETDGIIDFGIAESDSSKVRRIIVDGKGDAEQVLFWTHSIIDGNADSEIEHSFEQFVLRISQ